jgi:hypothetical protein
MFCHSRFQSFEIMKPPALSRLFAWLIACVIAISCGAARGEVAVDLSGYSRGCGVRVERENDRLAVAWPIAKDELGYLSLNLTSGEPLIKELGVAVDNGPPPLIENADPAVFVTVGSREVPPGKPSEQAWQVFFDNPHRRPHKTYASSLDKQRVRVTSHHERAVVSVEKLTAGPFSGALEFTFFKGCRLFRVDAVVSTQEDRLAIFYDAGMLCDTPAETSFAWMDTKGRLQRTPATENAEARPLAVRHRAIVLESDVGMGSLASFPPPHQFQFPRDYTDNLRFVWHGQGYNGLTDRFGFGVRQNKDGGGNFVPWFNAPPGTEQRMGVFYLLTHGSADDAMRETLRYTNGDRFPELPGYLTMTSHWHMAIAVAAMQRQGAAKTNPPMPDWVRMFKEMNVNMVHLGEFHGDGHQKDPGPLRLPELAAMFDECRRWSDDELLVIPGEEVNTFLGLELQGKHPGHWMSLFPRPVYWTMQRSGEQPFVEEHPQYGKVYHVGTRGDMIRLLKEENGLAWAAHPRIKASSWTPDIFREEDFFLAEYWLGAAWKAMPADLSRERLGERVLDLLDDMAKWGHKKYVLGEVDVFKIDHTHELYGHMNVNYVRLDRLPRFDEGWQPLLDALREGQFFVTTGEVLIPEFTVGGKSSGETLSLSDNDRPGLRVELAWTFPLSFAEIVSGDGQKVYHEKIDLSDTASFGRKSFTFQPELKDRRWARLEVWDIASNGAFTQPVWLSE